MEKLAYRGQRNSVRVFICFIVSIFIFLSFSPVAYATGTDSELSDANVQAFVTSVCKVQGGAVVIKDSKVAAWLKTEDAGIESPTTVVVTVDGTTATFYASSSSMKALHKYISDKKSSDKVTDKISGMTDGFNMEADTAGAATMMGGFQEVVSIVAGLVLYFAVLMMGIYSAFDVCYIAFPYFRVKCDDMKQGGGNSAMVKQNSQGEGQLRWVTDDAQDAIKASLNGSGKSPWGIYLKKRIISYVAMGIVVFMLATGQMDLFIKISLKWVAGIIEALSGMAN